MSTDCMCLAMVEITTEIPWLSAMLISYLYTSSYFSSPGIEIPEMVSDRLATPAQVVEYLKETDVKLEDD